MEVETTELFLCWVDIKTTAFFFFETYETSVTPFAENPNSLEELGFSRRVRQHFPRNFSSIAAYGTNESQTSCHELCRQSVAVTGVSADLINESMTVSAQ